MTIHIRPATESEQAAIQALVRQEGLNPINVRWPNFQVAEDGGRLAGIGQIRPHGGGIRELASLAVVKDRRREGIGRQLVLALMQDQAPPVYLFCEQGKAAYYARFGFHPVRPAELPKPLARIHRLANWLVRIEALLKGHSAPIVPMRWDGAWNGAKEHGDVASPAPV